MCNATTQIYDYTLDASEPTDVYIVNNATTVNSVVIKWSLPDQPRGDVRGYVIKYKESEASCSRNGNPKNCGQIQYARVRYIKPKFYF